MENHERAFDMAIVQGVQDIPLSPLEYARYLALRYPESTSYFANTALSVGKHVAGSMYNRTKAWYAARGQNTTQTSLGGSQTNSGGFKRRPRMVRQKSRHSAFQKTSGKETHLFDMGATTFASDTTGTVQLLNGVAQGTDYGNRVGRRITMTSVFIRGTLKSNSTNPTAAQARILLVLDRETNGVVPAIGDVLSTVTTTGNVDLDNTERFTILMDQTLAVKPYFATQIEYIPFKFYKKIRLPAKYIGTGATVASVGENGLFLMTLGDFTAGTATAPEWILTARMRFFSD